MTTSTLVLAVGIVSASFFGSWHCAAMCGPIASLMSARKSLVSYHLGRMIFYTLLGALAGSLGQFFLNSTFVTLRWVSSIILGILLVTTGLALILPTFLNQKISGRWHQGITTLLKKIQSFHLGRSGIVVGLLTALLPCGWLYTYVFAAIATKSPYAGAFTLFLFWLGGLPTLSAVPLMVRSTIQSAGLRHQRIAGTVLMISGLYAIASFMIFS